MSDATLNELIYEFLDKEGVSNLSKAILTKVNSRIQDRIVTDVNETSDNNHVPSAAAVYTAISRMSHIKFKTHTGNIDDITEPNGSYIYLQRDNDQDTTWMMYVYDESLGWINIGDTEVDLSNYWSKDPADVEALKLALGIAEDIAAVDAKIDQFVAELNKKVDDLPANLLFSETGDFAIYLTSDMNTSLVDYVFTLQKPGMYTIYAQRNCPDNPVSPEDSSFRGICHITQLETETQQLYGWIMLFDQVGNTYVNYIRRSVASGWKTSSDNVKVTELEAKVQSIETELNNKVEESQMVKLTETDIAAAVNEAFLATDPTL